MKFPRFPISQPITTSLILFIFQPLNLRRCWRDQRISGQFGRARFKRMERAMLTKSKFTGAALATLALVGCLVATSGNAQAHPPLLVSASAMPPAR